MRKKLGDILPLLMVLAGLAILLYPTVSNFLVERNSSRAIASYDQAVEDLSEEEYAQMLADARAYNQGLAALSGGGRRMIRPQAPRQTPSRSRRRTTACSTSTATA